MASEQATEEVKDRKKELQSLYLLPAVAQFVSLYRFAFKLPEIEIEELEDGLLEENEVGAKVLEDLLIALLKGIMPTRGVNSSNLEENLQRVLRKFWKQEKKEEYPYPDEATFSQIDIAHKVDLLHYLCCMRVDKSDAQDAMKTMDAEALRVQPLGNDDQGNEYWYFFGTRLYKQEPPKEKAKNWEDEWNHQKDQSFNKRGRGRGRPRKVKPRKSDGESDDFEDVNPGAHGRYMNIDEKSRWSVVCNTIEDWVDFAEKLKSSKSKNEKALFHTVTDNFLPVLNEIYQEKERRLQQKLRELVPRRVITRRETRRQRVKSIQDMNGYDAETAHREHLARDRAQRLEERNRRLSQSAERSKSRGRRAKYVEEEDEEDEDDYEDEDDFQELVESPPESDESIDYRKEYMPVITGEGTDLKSQVLKVLSEVKLQKDAWPFLYPVDETYAPGYYEIVNDPMDLSTMSSKLLDNAYKTIGHIDEDFRKMVDNCKLYNGENSGMSSMVMNLWRVFRRGMSKIGNPSDKTPNASQTEPTISRTTQFPQPEENSSDDYQMKRSSESQDGRKKKKKKIKHMDALELLSEQAKIAVEKSQSNDSDCPQPSQYNLYSDLKIVPIHNHPASLIEKFSDSSNQEMDDLDSSNASASSYAEQGSNPPAPANSNAPEKESDYLPQNEDSSDLTDFINKNNGKGFNILSDGEGNNPSIMSDNEGEIQPGNSTPYSASQNSRGLKALPNSNGLVQQNESSNALGERNNENMSSMLSGLPMYSVDGQRISPVGGNLVDSHNQNGTNHLRKSPQQGISSFVSIPNSSGRNASVMQMSHGSNTSNEVTILNSRKSPQQSMSSFASISSTAGPSLMQELPAMHSQNNSSTYNQMSTVDVSALGMSNINYSNKPNEVTSPPVNQVPHPENQSMDTFSSSNPFAKIPNQTSPKSKPRYSPTFSQQQQVQANSFQNQPGHQSQDLNVLQYQPQRSNSGDHSPINISNSSVLQYQTQTNNSIPNQIQRPNNHSPTNLPNSVATFTTHMSPQSSANSSSLMQLPPHLSKKFHNPGQILLQPNSDSGKFSSMKVSLPPSTGELLVVPGDPGSNSGMTFHLFAQPQGNMSQPIRAQLQVAADGSVHQVSNQANGMDNQYATLMRKPAIEEYKSRDDSSQPTKRKSPVVQYLQASTAEAPTTSNAQPHFPTTTNTMPNITPPLVRPSALRHSGPMQHVMAQDTPRNLNTFLQSTTAPYTLCSTAMQPVFPTYSYRQASANGVTVTTPSSAVAKPPRINIQKVFLPPPNQNTIVQNGNGQYILLPQQSKDGAKRLPTGETSPKQLSGESRMEAATSASFYPGVNNMFTFQPAPGNPSQMYAQVLPNQLPQYVNPSTPYYILADPTSLQNPQRYPLMNMQTVPFPNR